MFHTPSTSPSRGLGLFNLFKKSTKKKGDLIYGEDSLPNSPETKTHHGPQPITKKGTGGGHCTNSSPSTSPKVGSYLSDEERELALEDITKYTIPTIIGEPIPVDVISILKKVHHDDDHCSPSADNENKLVDIDDHLIPGLMATDFDDEENNDADNQRRHKQGHRSVSWDPDVKDTPERSCSYRKYVESYHRELQRRQREKKHRYEQMQREHVRHQMSSNKNQFSSSPSTLNIGLPFF